jgi:hypothetical protein
MKRYNFIFLALMSFSINANDKRSCDINSMSQCSVELKKTSSYDDANYDVKLVSSKTQKEVFSGVESNTSMESLSLQSINNTYVFMKESSASGKSIELVSFDFNKELASSIRYFYIENSISSEKRSFVWSGKECVIGDNAQRPSGKPTLLSSFFEVCNSNGPLVYNSKVLGKDIIFEIEKVSNNKKIGAASVIALDSSGAEHISSSDIGCMKGCDDDEKKSVLYIGKINSKFRITINLSFDGGNIVSGYYYYDRHRQPIDFSGTVLSKKIKFETNYGELFEGVLDSDKIIGEWHDSSKNKKYNFIVYKLLVQ